MCLGENFLGNCDQDAVINSGGQYLQEETLNTCF